MTACGQDTEDDKLPTLRPSAIEGRLGETLVEAAVLQMGQLYERRSGLDFGVDGVIELTTGTADIRATGCQIGVQVKRGLSNAIRTRFGFTYYCSEAHANYWLTHSLPIIVVHSDPISDQLRWCHVTPETLRRTPKGYAIDLPPESELRTSLEALKALVRRSSLKAPPACRNFRLLYSMQGRVHYHDPELGLAALEFSRAILRGDSGRVEIDLEEEPDLVARIDSVRDQANPSADARREALIYEEILARYKRKSARFSRALQLLLAEKQIAEAFVNSDELLSEAIRWLIPPTPHARGTGDVRLQAWPSHRMERPIVTFDVPATAMQDLYAANDANRLYIRMGSIGGMIVGDLHPDVIAARFLPTLARGLVDFAETCEIDDCEALAKIGVPPSMWLMGLA